MGGAGLLCCGHPVWHGVCGSILGPPARCRSVSLHHGDRKIPYTAICPLGCASGHLSCPAVLSHPGGMHSGCAGARRGQARGLVSRTRGLLPHAGRPRPCPDDLWGCPSARTLGASERFHPPWPRCGSLRCLAGPRPVAGPSADLAPALLCRQGDRGGRGWASLRCPAGRWQSGDLPQSL